MLSKSDEKSSKDGLNFGAIFQLFMAAAIFLLWGKSILNTFSTKDKPEKINYSATLQAEQVAFLMENQKREDVQEIVVNVPTQQINVIVNYPTPTPEPIKIVSPTPENGIKSTLGKSYDFVIVPAVAGREPTSLEGETILVRSSWYYPPFGNVLQDNPYHINCDRVPNTDLPECDYTASGFTWFNDVGYWAACPADFPFGTKLIIKGREFLCMDRGGAIVYENEVAWIDILYPENPFSEPWGSVLSAIKIEPYVVGE